MQHLDVRLSTDSLAYFGSNVLSFSHPRQADDWLDLVPEPSDPLRLTVRWTELLWDLACLDPLWVETRVSGISLRQRMRLQAIHIDEGIGLARGASFRLHVFLNTWQSLVRRPESSERRFQDLVIEARDRSELLSLSVDEQAHPFVLQTLMRAYGIQDGRVMPPSRPGAHRPGLSAHMHTLARRREQGRQDVEIADLAECCGWLNLTPARLHAQGRARPAASELIPCFLETVADQSLMTRVTMGTAGAVQSFDGCFYAYRKGADGWVELLGEGACLRLDPESIDSAWVVERLGPDGDRHQLRLYDESGRALLLMEDLVPAGGVPNPVWRLLVNALF
ncbi:MAG: hypothetical protein MZV65_10235 [Chromatiales bacterium]|nr:hypothetical protein [Chromatiales bacterium]